MGIKAFISGCTALSLSAEEQDFFNREKPWALILFQRNCETTEQIKELIADFREAVGNPEAPVLIDQEGGRVQRLKPPLWPAYVPSCRFGQLLEIDKQKAVRAAWLQSRLIAHDLNKLDININCLPVLDVPQKDADQIIGDRAYAETPGDIITLAQAAIDGLVAGGVLPVMKHVPGHGRAQCDSHLELPVVTENVEALKACDFAPFKALNDTPLAMTAHILYAQLDPKYPATHSQEIISHIIRDYMGFNGCLMSDDLSMKALKGSLKERTEKTFAAGCDMALHCNGDMKEMRDVAAATPILAGRAAERAEASLSMLTPPEPIDITSARAELAELVPHTG